MKIDLKHEPAVIAMVTQIDRQATNLERAGNRHLKEARELRDLSAAMIAKFRRIKTRMDHGRRK